MEFLWLFANFIRINIFVFIVTIRISNVDEVEADDVVAGVAIAWCGLVQAVNVEAGSEDRPDAQHLSFGK